DAEEWRAHRGEPDLRARYQRDRGGARRRGDFPPATGRRRDLQNLAAEPSSCGRVCCGRIYGRPVECSDLGFCRSKGRRKIAPRRIRTAAWGELATSEPT